MKHDVDRQVLVGMLNRAFGVSGEGFGLDPDETDRLMDMVSKDPVFTRAWRGALRNHVFPLLRLLRERSNSDEMRDYVGESHALMRVLSYVADQHRIGGHRVPVNIEMAGPDRTDGAYAEILDRLEGSLFAKGVAELSAARFQALVAEELMGSNYRNVCGLDIHLNQEKLLLVRPHYVGTFARINDLDEVLERVLPIAMALETEDRRVAHLDKEERLAAKRENMARAVRQAVPLIPRDLGDHIPRYTEIAPQRYYMADEGLLEYALRVLLFACLAEIPVST